MIHSITAILACLCLVTAVRAETDQKTAQPAANEATRCVCEWPTNGAAVGEPISDRIARLETALRLSRAEVKIRGRRK